MNDINITYMSANIGETLRKIRESQDLTIEQLAEMTGIAPGHIGRIERSDSSNPRFQTIEALAKALGVNPQAILYPKENQAGSERPKQAFDAPNYIPQDIPVIGLTKAGRGGFFDNDGYPSGGEGFRKVHRPIDVKDPNAYALVVEGDSMSPMLEKGWIVYVCPNHNYVNGDLVIVALNTDEVMIKKFRKQDGVMMLQSINPAYEPLILVPDGYKFIHKVCLIKPK